MISEQEYRKVIARNLRNIMFERQKTQADVARDLGINKATLSSWMNGTRTPKMEKIDMLCKYFNVPRSAIMEPDGHRKTPVTHITEEQAQLIQLTMQASADNVHIVLELLKKLEGMT